MNLRRSPIVTISIKSQCSSNKKSCPCYSKEIVMFMTYFEVYRTLWVVCLATKLAIFLEKNSVRSQIKIKLISARKLTFEIFIYLLTSWLTLVLHYKLFLVCVLNRTAQMVKNSHFMGSMGPIRIEIYLRMVWCFKQQICFELPKICNENRSRSDYLKLIFYGLLKSTNLIVVVPLKI